MNKHHGNWIASAINPAHKGAFTAKAKAAGKSVAAFAQEKASSKGTIGRQARLAKTLRSFSRKG